jgi:protein MAK16
MSPIGFGRTSIDPWSMTGLVSDSLIWEILRGVNCTFRVKAIDRNFCRNVDSTTGLCDHRACPLANSQYATARLISGKIYLSMKTAERAHLPGKMWQRIELPEDSDAGMAIIDRELQYWDEWLINKIKFRYTRIIETLQNMRRLRPAPKVKSLPIKKRVERRNAAREERALSVAHIEHRVKEELLTRLRQGVYDIYNLEEEEFNEALDDFAQEIEFVDESDFEDEEEEEQREIELA